MNKGRNAFLFWKIDPTQLNEQIVEYHTLSIWKSARKSSSILLLLSCAITTAMSITQENYSGLADAGLFLVLAVFVYGGHKWAIAAAMTLWSFEKGFAIVINPGKFALSIVWWLLYMKPLYLAFIVGRKPAPPTEEKEVRTA